MKDQELLKIKEQVQPYLAAHAEETTPGLKELKAWVSYYEYQENIALDKIQLLKVADLQLKKDSAYTTYLKKTTQALQQYTLDNNGQRLSSDAAKHYAQSIYENSGLPSSSAADFKTTFVQQFNIHFKTDFSEKLIEEIEEKEKLSQNKEDLIKKLNLYIGRIESYKKTVGDHEEIDFSYGFRFPFFRESRALNRKANYNLAQQLKDQLSKDENNKNITHIKDLYIVAHPKKIREDFFQAKNRSSFANHGINSQELNAILKAARRM